MQLTSPVAPVRRNYHLMQVFMQLTAYAVGGG